MSDNKLTIKGFLVWGVCALFFLYEFFLRTVIGTFQHPLMSDLQLTSFQFSLLSTTIFLFIYGIMQIPASMIFENFGLKKTLTMAVVVCTASSFGFAYSYSFVLAIFFRLLMGFGASFGFLGLLVSVHEWMPHRYSGLFIGLSQFIGTLGPMVAAGPLETLAESSGISWRFLFAFLGFIGLFLAIITIIVVENNQEKAGKYIILQRPEKMSTSIARLFSRIQPLYIAILSACLYFTIEYLSENEGRAFLMLKGASGPSASYMLTVAWLGFAVGCPLIGFLSDWMQRRKIILSVFSVVGLIAISSILYVPGIQHLYVAFFVLGLSASAQGVGFAMMAEQFKKHFVAIGFGLNNAMITTVSAINAPLIGLAFDRIKKGSVPSLEDYHAVFFVLVVIALIGVIVSIFFIKETYCKSSVDFTYLKIQPSNTVTSNTGD